jgi:hypothetical protein
VPGDDAERKHAGDDGRARLRRKRLAEEIDALAGPLEAHVRGDAARREELRTAWREARKTEDLGALRDLGVRWQAVDPSKESPTSGSSAPAEGTRESQ